MSETKLKETPAQRRARFLAEGLCGNCGKRQPEPKVRDGVAVGTYKECSVCREYFRNWAAARKAKKEPTLAQIAETILEGENA
jgi:hypothetical protein